ncbi:MAG: tRNA (adenosine(37)-N6)-threonylcarbamoyltransferase complex ATPase subunit type 1 TsaE [Syntrophomonadaceae bacterium]|nr:tRNA (adenosine(37)-N6)-threonylcarbamoyltransferase complex ATPase subunit type 1 TsaE [Syntrophomonadaceae bacterium]
MELLIYSDEEMNRLGILIAQHLKGDEIIYLSGELGAGKTTLVRGIMRGLDYQGKVTSPTFTLMNLYSSHPPVFHFDFYRLGPGEIEELGLQDYLEKDGISMIEWPEIAWEELPREALQIKIELMADDYDRERRVIITGQGEKYCRLIEELKSDAHFGN